MKADQKKCPKHNKKYKLKCCQCEEYICSRCTQEAHANHKNIFIKYELETVKIETSRDLALISDFTNTYHKKIAELRLICLQYIASTTDKFRALREKILRKANEKVLKIQDSVYEKLSQFEGKCQNFMNSNNSQICKVYDAESVLKRVYEIASWCLEKKCDIAEYVQLKKSINFQNVENLIKFANGDYFTSQRNRFEEEGKEIEKFLENSKRSIDIDNEVKMEYESLKNLVEGLKAQKATLQEEIRILKEKNEELAAECNTIKKNTLKLQDEQVALIKKMQIGEEEKLQSETETIKAKEACILSVEVVNKY